MPMDPPFTRSSSPPAVLSLSNPIHRYSTPASLCFNPLLSPTPHNRSLRSRCLASFSYQYNPLSLRFSTNYGERMVLKKNKKKMRIGAGGAVCYAAPLTPHNLQWISAISSAVLMIAKGTAVHKSFIVPLFALQAPSTIIEWMKGEYGAWAAFLALLVRLFFHIPGELELPFMALLLVIVAPHQVLKLRGTQEGAIISILIAAYLCFMHFSRNTLRSAFDQGSVVATVAVICITVVSLLLII